MTAVYQSTSAQKAAHWCGSVESMLRQRQEWIDDPAAMAGSPEAMRLMPDFLLSLDYYQQDYAFHHRLATGLISRIDWDRGQDGSARYVVEALASYFQITGSLSLWDEARQQIGPILGETPAGAGSLTAPEIPAESHAGRRPVSVYTFFCRRSGSPGRRTRIYLRAVRSHRLSRYA